MSPPMTTTATGAPTPAPSPPAANPPAPSPPVANSPAPSPPVANSPVLAENGGPPPGDSALKAEAIKEKVAEFEAWKKGDDNVTLNIVLLGLLSFLVLLFFY